MKKIISLTKVFAKEFFQNVDIFNKQKKKFNKKSIFFWLISIILIGITYVSYVLINFLVKSGQPEIFLNLFFWLLTILLLFQLILISANLFFFSKDIEKVLHLPLKPVELLLAKFNTLLLMLYVTEAILAVIPLTLYGMYTQAHVLYYFWELILLSIFPILLEVVITTIMLIIMKVGKFIKNKDSFQIIITIFMIIVMCFLENRIMQGMFSIQNDEQAMEQISSFNEKAKNINQYFLIINPSIAILENPFSLKAITSFLQLMIYIAVGGSIFLIIGKYNYIKEIIKNNVSYNKIKNKKISLEKNIKNRHKSISYIIKEVKMIIKEPIFFIQCVFPVIIILITIFLLLLVMLPNMQELLKEEEIKNKLQNLSFSTEIVCDILIVLQVLFSISNISLTAISREGKNAIFIKYIPIELYKQFVYKAMPQIMLNLFISIIILGTIWYVIPTINIIYLMMTFIIAFFMNLINSYLMLVVDLRRPNLDWNTEYSVVKKSDNKIFQYAFLIINILFLLYMAKIFKEINIMTALICETIIFVTVFIFIDRCIKKWQNKLFNKIF